MPANFNCAQVALNRIEITESLEVATATIVEKLAACEFYASVYVEMLSNPTIADNLRKSLESAFPEFYASVLVFSVKARLYFDPSTPS